VLLPKRPTIFSLSFDPTLSGNCIGLDQAARDSAAAWLPRGMGYDGETDDSPETRALNGIGHSDADAD
jgi:hypothetical protein